MVLSETSTIISLAAIIGYVAILLASYLRRGKQEQLEQYLSSFLLASILWEFALIVLPENAYPPDMDMVFLLLGTMILMMATAVYTIWAHIKWQVIGSAIAILIVLLLKVFLSARVIIIAHRVIPISETAAHAVWLIMGVYLLVRTWHIYESRTLPWHANRLLAWAIILWLIFAGEGILIFGNTAVSHLLGQTLRLIGTMGVAYVIASHRIFDVRTRSLNLLAFIIITSITAVPLITIIIFAQAIFTTQRQFLIAITIIIFITFITHHHFRSLIERIVYRYLPRDVTDPRQVLRRYSQDVYQILDVQHLSLVIINTLSDLLNMDRGALILITTTDEGYEIEPVPSTVAIPRKKLVIARNDIVIGALLQRQQPLLQYDLDFNPQFDEIDTAVRQWLRDINMEAYVPIGTSKEIAGFITIGPKRSGVPYQASELELVQLLADQTVIALQNARLYSELSNRNDAVRHLNMDLIAQNERLEVMDKVKADFITIASHELRTPLTQVKGYTDILEAMNDSQALTPKQTQEILGHIKRATKRLESLISAMLDASQLDAEGMRLSFMDSSINTIVRIAIEPMAKAIRARHISIHHDELSAIPPIRADFKRLVQAFSNLISNAVKYTPDHGSITIRATMIADQDDEEKHMQVVITDTGIGIDPKYHELIFEKFFRIGDTQLHSTGSTKFKGAGTGLGLTIAKGVIEAHGGRIWVESEGEDEERLPGSRFYIILPLIPPGAEIVIEEEKEDKREEERPSWLIG